MSTKRLDFSAQLTINDVSFRVRPVKSTDIETLRVWKNNNKQFFHNKDTITPEQQTAWFEQFSKDITQQLFVCEVGTNPVACVGYREKTPEVVELFNLICGHPEFAGQGHMTRFYEETVNQLKGKGIVAVELEVLKHNEKAIKWYLSRGYKQVGEGADFLKLSHTL